MLWSSFLSRGQVYFAEGHYDRALADYEQAILLEPKIGDVYAGRAEIEALRNRFENAKADAETAIRLSPTLSGAHAFLGYAFAKQGDFDRATAEIGEAFRLDPRSLDALLYRGELHLLRGEPRRALDDFEAALVRRPVFPLAIAGRDAAKKALATEIATSSSPREPQPAPGPPAAPTQNLGTAQTDSLSIDQSNSLAV